MSVVMNFEESAGAGVNKVAASNSRINIVQQESVCFKFKLLNLRIITTCRRVGWLKGWRRPLFINKKWLQVTVTGKMNLLSIWAFLVRQLYRSSCYWL